MNNTSGFLFPPMTKDSPGKTIMLKEKYGSSIIVDHVNIVGFADGQIIVTRMGDVFGRYSQENWAVSVVPDEGVAA
jgi:hypothetical protein